MASAEALLFGPLGWSVIHSGGAATLSQATKAAIAGAEHVISGFSISANGVPAAAVLAQLKDGVTVIDQWFIPASAFAPIIMDFKRPFVITVGTLAELSLPSLGGAISGSVTLRGLTRRV